MKMRCPNNFVILCCLIGNMAYISSNHFVYSLCDVYFKYA